MSEDKENESYGKPKPWMLHDISIDAREIALKNSKKYGVRIGQWVDYIILKSVDDEEKREAEQREEEENRQTFQEMIEEFPTKGLMVNIYNRLNTSIEELSKKVERQYKPWWKFWG